MGTTSFVSNFVDRKSEALRISLDKLSGLHCSHSASLILQSCVGASKVTYLLRVLSPSSGRILAKAVSSLLQSTWSDICGASLEAATWDLATLPVRRGGLGVVDPVDIAGFAALSSFLSASFAAQSLGISLPGLSPDHVPSLSGIRNSAPTLAEPLFVAITPDLNLVAAAWSRLALKFLSGRVVRRSIQPPC